MNFDLSEEQGLLKATLNQYLAARYRFAERRAASLGKPGYRADIWQDFAGALGLLGGTLPVSVGGLGGGAVEQMIIMEEMGRFLVLEPVAETLFQGAWLLEKCGAHDLLPDIISGDVRLALAVGEPVMRYDLAGVATNAAKAGNGWTLTGGKSVVVAAPWATHLIVAARTNGSPGDAHGLSLFLVPAQADGVTLHPYSTIDGRRAADIKLEGAAGELIGQEGQGLALLEEVRDRGIAAQAAEAAGLLDRLVSDTIDYTKQRQQFGQAISQFQVLQHRMVDMHIQREMVRSAAILATLKLDGDPVERALAASAAKVTVANACQFIGQNAVQLHGGMGMTDELSIGHYFKRAIVMESEFGSADWHLARHAALSMARAA